MAKKTREEANLEKARRQLEQAQAEFERAELETAHSGPRQKRPKLKKDARVKMGAFSWGFFLCVFLGMLTINSCQIMVYSAMAESGATWLEMAPSLVGFACLMSLVVCLVIVGVRSRSFNQPVRYLGDAARQVAAGDFSVYVAPMRKDGKKDYLEVLIDDFNTMVEELGGIEEMKNDLIGNVSHEIKTPVAVIQNYASALQKEGLSAGERREYTATIIEASKKLSYLVSNILMLNKLESQEIVATGKRYNLSDQLAECALVFEEHWEARGLVFSAELKDAATVEYDPDLLEIVWKGLFANAIKFSESGGTITLTQKNEGGHTFVTVSDTGCGLDLYFEPMEWDSFNNEKRVEIAKAALKYAFSVAKEYSYEITSFYGYSSDGHWIIYNDSSFHIVL